MRRLAGSKPERENSDINDSRYDTLSVAGMVPFLSVISFFRWKRMPCMVG